MFFPTQKCTYVRFNSKHFPSGFEFKFKMKQGAILFSTSNFKHKCFLSLPASEASGALAEASEHSLCEAARCCAMGGVTFRVV